MRTKVYFILLMIVISLSVPQPVMAQDIVDDAVKVVGGLINVIGKKKKAKQKVQQEQQTATKKNDSKVTNGAQDVEQREQTPPLDIFKTMLLPPSEGLDLVIIDKEKVNVRKTPNGPIRQKFGENIFYEGWRMTSGKIYPSGWLYALEGSASGFISPKVFHKAKLDPFQPWMFNKVEAYKKKSNGEERTWRLGINKESGLVLKIGNERDTEIFDKHLSIGRIENNLFYSFSSVTIDLNYDANTLNVRVNKLTAPKMSDGFYYQIVYGPNYTINTQRGARLVLEKLPSNILEQIFLPVDDFIYLIPNIPDDISQVSYSDRDGDRYLSNCINAELLSPPYVDYTPTEGNSSPVSQPATANSTMPEGELGIFELFGSVKKCVWKNGDEVFTYEFDRKGMWIMENGQKPWGGQDRVKRDRQGRIIKMGDSYDEEYKAYSYNTNGLISKKIDKYMDGMFQTNYFYNNKGECTKSVLEFEDMGETGKVTTSYTILSKDSKGNWTKRKTQEGKIESRTITYY